MKNFKYLVALGFFVAGSTTLAGRSADHDSDLVVVSWCSSENQVVFMNQQSGEATLVEDCSATGTQCVSKVMPGLSKHQPVAVAHCE